MSFFKKLPVLEGLKEYVKDRYGYPKANLNKTYLIGTQHLLHTTGSLIEAVIEMGLPAKNIFLNGKIYSTNPETFKHLKDLGIHLKESSYPTMPGYYAESLEADIKTMWSDLLYDLQPESKIVILDDGGYTLKNTPDGLWENNRLIGIEQTTSGARMMHCFGKFPVIMVATSNAKTHLEPAIVAESVKLRLGEVLKKFYGYNIGVVGLGNIGKAIVEEFASKYNLYLFDKQLDFVNPLQGVTICRTLQELYDASALIIGITGEDISDRNWLKYSNSDKTLMSLSSGDIEFNNLLRSGIDKLIGPYENPLATLKFKTDNGNSISVLRGGMVANFTGTPDSAPAESIQLTRGLLFSAVIQAIENGIVDRKAIELNKFFENEVVSLYKTNR